MRLKPCAPLVIAVELPAPCGQHCPICRTPDHGIGDPDAVRDALRFALGHYQYNVREVYLVSNGETGRARDFEKITSDLISGKLPVSVACAHPVSIVRGLARAEVSATRHTMGPSREAIRKALDLGVPVTISLVDDGEDVEERLAALNAEFPGLSGFLIRALQAEGRSTERGGHTRFGRFPPELPIGFFPVRAYKELEGVVQEFETVRINCWGKEVPFLGGFPLVTSAATPVA